MSGARGRGKYEMLAEDRRSVRTFDGNGIPEKEMQALRDFAENTGNPYDIPMEFRILNVGEHGLKSPVIAGADWFVAAKMQRVPHFEEALGFAIERFVLDACSIGIGTTLIGGTMDRPAFERAAELGPGEAMPLVTPIGRPAKKMTLKEVAMRKAVGADKRKRFEELFFNGDFDTPLTEAEAGFLLEPLQMVRLAPSAVNKQPWRLVRAGDCVHFYRKAGKGFDDGPAGNMQRIDIGIALCHFALTAEERGIRIAFEISDPQIRTPEGVEYEATYRILGQE